AGGLAQFMAATFNQQRTQAFEQGLVSFAKAGQTEQTVQRLTQITNWLVRRDKRQARTLDSLLAVQPPQAIAQRQRFDLLQYRSEAVADTFGLAQQPGATPDQFFEIVR